MDDDGWTTRDWSVLETLVWIKTSGSQQAIAAARVKAASLRRKGHSASLYALIDTDIDRDTQDEFIWALRDNEIVAYRHGGRGAVHASRWAGVDLRRPRGNSTEPPDWATYGIDRRGVIARWPATPCASLQDTDAGVATERFSAGGEQAGELPSSTGTAGRPSSMQGARTIFQERCANNMVADGIGNEAAEIVAAFHIDSRYCKWPRLTVKTVRNGLATEYRARYKPS